MNKRYITKETLFLILIINPSISSATFGDSIITIGNQCNFEDRDLIEESHDLMRISLASKAFEQCIDKRFRFGETGPTALGGNSGHGPYKECWHDPYYGESIDTQISKMIEIARNPQDITALNCSNKEFGTAWASLGNVNDHGTATQEYTWGISLKNTVPDLERRDSGTFSPEENWKYRGSWPWDNFAGVVFHEITHTHGYDHGSGDSAIKHCGQEYNTPWNFQENTAPYIAGACARSVLERSNAQCGWQTCDGGHMIIADYDGSTCICQKDPHKKLIDSIQGLWNLIHDGWHGHLEIYSSSSVEFTGRYRSTNDYIWKLVKGSLKDPFETDTWTDNRVDLRIDLNGNGNVYDDQPFELYYFNGEMAGKTWWNGNPFGVSAFRHFSSMAFHGERDGQRVQADHFTGIFQMSHDGGQGTLSLVQEDHSDINSEYSLKGEYTTSSGETHDAYGVVSGHELDLYVDLAGTSNHQKFELLLFTQTKAGMAGTFVRDGVISGVRLLKMRNPILKGLYDSTYSEKHFSVYIPEGTPRVAFKMSGGMGDADIYVRKGSKPTTSNWDYRPYFGGNDETVMVESPSAGLWFVMIRAYRAYSEVDFEVEMPTKLIDLSHLGGDAGTEQHYTVIVPTGAKMVEFKMFGNTSEGEFGGTSGDADIYIKHGTRPATTEHAQRARPTTMGQDHPPYDHRPYLGGNDESVSIENPEPGAYHIVIRGYRNYSGVELEVSVE